MGFHQMRSTAPTPSIRSYPEHPIQAKIAAPLVFVIVFISLLATPCPCAARTNAAIPSPFFVRFEKNLLSVHVKDISLITILEEVAEQTGVNIILYTSSEILVSANFSDLSLEEGLKRLTHHYNYALIFVRPHQKNKEQTIKLLIFSKAGSAFTANRTFIRPKTRKGEGSQKASLSSLLQELEDDDEDVREDAVDELAELKDQAAVAPLSRILQYDEDSDVRASAADALGWIGGPGVIKPLTQALADDDADVRESAVDSLGQIGGDEVIGPLVDAMRDNDEDVRASAVDALGQLGSDEVIGYLTEALNDEDEDVRSSARHALRRLGRVDVE